MGAEVSLKVQSSIFNIEMINKGMEERAIQSEVEAQNWDLRGRVLYTLIEQIYIGILLYFRCHDTK